MGTKTFLKSDDSRAAKTSGAKTDRPFKRKIYSKLLDWKDRASHEKALMIEGARRIGKSTIAEEFAKNEYRSYILIDFNDASDTVRNAFNSHLGDLDTFFMILGTEYNTPLHPNESVIIFDEVQQFPKARQSIKKLVKDGRFDYIETGSLISIKENVKDITIPSEERGIKMYPMDFEEFCWALGEKTMIEYIKQCFEDKKPLEEGLHHKAMLLFKQYMLVGGMPKVVSQYVDNGRSFIAADEEKRDILTLYKNDISKIDAKYRAKVSSIFEQIPSFLSQHEKRVRLSNIQKNSTYPMYQDTFYWLGDSMIANECFNCNDPNVGLSLNEERTSIKCYMGDTGLLVSHAFSENEIADGELYRQILRDNLSINEGMLFENVIAQSLACNGYSLFFYTKYNEAKHRADIEIDFIISNGSKTKPKIFPIEVKSTKRYTTTSLNKFAEIYHQRIGKSYVIHTKNFVEKEGVVCLPAYMAFLL
ncbi:ATP-binding protein [Bifidobacterium panos]|uniref:ATPase n=1 Tax=Bifidobacterium panos TaxID=2675321 RepID=A0ABX1SUN8_9BIFI|nr:AAA family ATPase [Bifidobacterium sp. DSM 109963]NMN01534.1 ATPase [Bifidobacterium sp. DSM 109963]